jgi:formate hydrogenlyase subunit 6/NADH:ubiquinone oxidoreductase subunit I
MKIGSMLGDVVRSLFKKPATQRYPFIKKPAPDNLRGKLTWDASKCTGCQLCIKDCPADAIELLVVDKVNKRFVFRYHVDRCTFCDQCVQSCRFKCIDLSDEEWELASLSKEPFTVYYGRDEDIQFLLDKAAHPEAVPCEEPAKP